MNEKLATVSGVYKKMELKEGLQVARITIEIPMSEALAFMNAFGTPDAAVPVPVVLARLAVPSAVGAQRSADKTTSPSPQDVTGDTPVPVKKPKTRSQIAHLKCNDPDFQDWLGVHPQVALDDREAHANTLLKERLGIPSKSWLDIYPGKMTKWDALLTDYDTRNMRR